MAGTTLDLIISLDAGENVSDELLSEMARQVHKDIRRAGADTVRWARSDEESLGTKGIPVDINTIVVSLASAGVLTAIVELLKDWALRPRGRTVRVKAQIGDESIEFEYSPTAMSEEELMSSVEKLIQLLNKHKIESP